MVIFVQNMTFKRQIPNLFTLSNLLCGCIGIILVFENKIHFSAYLILVAMVFDFLDGFLARLLNVSSEIGKQLDSLADLVTFGVLPGIIMYHLISLSLSTHSPTPTSIINDYSLHTESSISLTGFGLIIPLFSAIRLARFNIDTRQSNVFIGLPTPALALFISGLTLSLSQEGIQNPVQNIIKLLSSPTSLILFTLILSTSLILPIRLLALKFNDLSWRSNKTRYIFLSLCFVTISGALLINFVWIALPIIILLYIIVSIINNIISKHEIQS